MAKKTSITIGDVTAKAVHKHHQHAFMLLLPVGGRGGGINDVVETGKTAEETTIKGNGTQKDRGIEFDYPAA
jgi:hypothetical protein